eukprot:Sspe_Gene.16111::Locus_5666_Transcript_1_1_Confidence_1.000_Length_1843::g.16111::m.16111/K04564/SOD2; superoxide dismutase, Fe-Mn family
MRRLGVNPTSAFHGFGGRVRRRSSALRKPMVNHDNYYPREWFSQTENGNMTIYSGTSEWIKSLPAKQIGVASTVDERRERFWKMEGAMRETRRRKQEKTGYHFLPYLDWPVEKGCKPFLSNKQAQFLYTVIHQGHVDALCEHIQGTQFEAVPLEDLIKETAFDAANALIHYRASMHWNMLFFWKSIVPYGSVDVPLDLRRAIHADFCKAGPREEQRSLDSLENLRKEFIEEGMQHPGNGFLWLLWDKVQHQMAIKVTSGHQCPISLGWTPLLGCSLWEHASLFDYKDDRLTYLQRFWLCIDWSWVAHCLKLSRGEGVEMLSIDFTGRDSPFDVHLFPSSPTLQDRQKQIQAARGFGVGDPLEGIRKQWESWRANAIENSPGLMGPSMHMASHEDQEADVKWNTAHYQHIVGTHSTQTIAPPPVQWLGWVQTERWFEQLQAWENVHKAAVHPPLSGIPIPEEGEQHTPILALMNEEVEEPPEYQEGDPKPWVDMREQWFHPHVHEPEHDFWRKRVKTGFEASSIYFGGTLKTK